MTNDERNELKLKEVAVAAYIESVITGRLPSEREIEDLMKNYCTLLYPNIDNDSLNEMKKMLNERFQFRLDIGTLIYDEECEPWFKEFKANNKCYYFDRYKEYLMREKGFNRQALDILDNEVLDEIMDYLDHKDLNELDEFKNESPSSEFIAKFIYKKAQEKIPQVYRVNVWETPTSRASYFEIED